MLKGETALKGPWRNQIEDADLQQMGDWVAGRQKLL